MPTRIRVSHGTGTVRRLVESVVSGRPCDTHPAAEQDADGAAQERSEDGLGDEQAPDLAALGAGGAQDPDLPGAFQDADIDGVGQA